MPEIPAEKALPPEVDVTRPNNARIYDYFLGGKDHFTADRAVAEEALAKVPSARVMSRESRAFLGRVVRFLAEEAGIRQFLDIGTGLPTSENVHEVAQRIEPSSRVVYVDNDPMVIAHARALLRSSSEGQTAYVRADFRDPQAILSDPAVRETIDFDQPVALMLFLLLPFISNRDKPAELVTELLDALPPGSYLAASHLTAEHGPEILDGGNVYWNAGFRGRPRDSDEFAEMAFHGLELVPPGVVLVSEWRREAESPRPAPSEINCYGGVARKPG
ncbi:MAG: SAM-dependent methyltransferase [Streptosporangiales bacterium]|nr:SAM-dependent methyltransferase [Streptosporangiales bacterium]